MERDRVEVPTSLIEQRVLDHGYVRYVDHMGGDETVIAAARMSTARGFERWDAGEVCKHCRVPREKATEIDACPHEPTEVPGDAKLLEYLFSNGHTTPFEMCVLQIEVLAPILVWRQWHRHRMASYNEQSARYGPLPDLFYVPSEERLRESFKASTNKQASGSGASAGHAAGEAAAIRGEQAASYALYEERIKDGMAPELARLNVGVSIYSKCRVKLDLHNLLNGFLRLRAENHAQWEIRQYAEAVERLAAAIWPRSYALYEEYVKGSVKFSKTEIEALREWIADEIPSTYLGKKLNDKKRAAFLHKLGLEG